MITSNSSLVLVNRAALAHDRYMSATLEHLYYYWPARTALGAARWATGGGGGGQDPCGYRRGEIGWSGQAGIRHVPLEARKHQRGKSLQISEKGGRSERQGSDGEEVRGVQVKLERATLGSASRGTEWGGARERPQHTGQGNQNRTDNGGTSSEGICHRGWYQAGVTEHSDGEGRVNGDGTLGAPEGERGCGIPTRDKFDSGHSHLEWRGLICLGNEGG